MQNNGMVYLVGAGPGASDLVTVRGKSLIEFCDVLVYDYLVYDELLTWTRPGCEMIYVGKRSGFHAKPQKEIEALLIRHAGEGKTVVRLKGGDPFIFGRGGEEAEALQKAGIPFEVVPGVTASLGTAAFMGFPLTHREDSSSVVMVTGHEDPAKPETVVDWTKYAGLGATLCIYMGMTNLERISRELIGAGMAGDTPVAVVRWATLPRQESCFGTLATIPHRVAERGIKPPAMIVIGPVVKDFPASSWYESKPLFGKRVVVTRTRRQAGELARRLTGLGADVMELPLIRVRRAVDEAVKREVFSGLGSYDWIVFTSQNGVRYFFDLFLEEYRDLRSLGFVRFAAVGPSTAREVEKFHLAVDLVPEKHTGSDLAEALIATGSLDNAKILAVKGNLGGETLIKRLEDQWAMVDRFEVYKTEPTDLSLHPVARRFREMGAHAITFTSSSTVKSFVQQAEFLQLKPGAVTPRAFSIGPVTSQTMSDLKMPLTRQARQSTLDSLVQALLEEMIRPEFGIDSRKDRKER